MIVTGSWDKNIKLWDPRANQCTGTYQQPEKVLKTILEFLSPDSNHFLFYCVVEAASGENQAGQLTNNEVWVPRKKPKWLLIDCLILHANVLLFLFETKQEILIRSRVTYSCMVSFHSLCHYWERLFTSEIATSGSIWIPCFWLAVKIRSRQINRFWAGFFFFSNEWVPNNSSDHLMNFAHTNTICLLSFPHQLLALDISGCCTCSSSFLQNI